MLNKTLSEVAQLVIKELSMVYGTSVQTYAEARIYAKIQSSFESLFDEHWWPQFMGSDTYTLDGSTGVVTTDLTDIIKRFDDIYAVYADTDVRPLPQLPKTMNPNVVGSGAKAKFVEPINDASKVFRVRPLTATSTVSVVYRTMPDEFGEDDAINMDSWLLVYYTCWNYAEDDGTNPGQIEKFRNLFVTRLEQLKSNQNNLPVPLSDTGYNSGVPTEWYPTSYTG